DSWEWVLGPTDANPGGLPAAAPPDVDDLFTLVEAANAEGGWELPAVDASRGSSPWGSSIASEFTDAARYVWADTFDNDSVTNVEDTYALFRSSDPLVVPAGNMELDSLPTTLTFRTDFAFDGSPSATELTLDCLLDDGAVVYLNGDEVLRENLPAGALDADTLASVEVGDPTELVVGISSDPLVVGTNVLAVELHQATSKDADMAFGCELSAKTWSDSVTPTVLFNEVAAAGDAFWVEVVNVSGSALSLDGLVVTSSAGGETLLE
ncbi:MAG: hypothetical protein GY913_32700, partial [Proteobacteria bacterium]|nr:hypothetical protein [Pseudomonadota bacterium]